MQFLQALTRDPKTIAREAPAGAKLPYARHLDDATIMLRDGLLMQTIQLRGLLFETADSDELNYRAQLRDGMLRSLGSSRFALYHHVIRRRADIATAGRVPGGFASELDTRWRERLGERNLFVNELFLTIVRRPLQGKIGAGDRVRNWLSRKSGDPTETIERERRALDKAREAMMAALGAYEPRLLTRYQTSAGVHSEPLEFLACLFNAQMRPMLEPAGDLGMHVPSRRISFGTDALELGKSGLDSRRFQAIVSIKDYPGRTTPGVLDELYRLPIDLTFTQSFALVERGEALGRMKLALRRMKSSEDDALSLRDELVDAKDEVAAGRAGFGEHHTTIAVHASTLEQLDSNVAEVIAIMADSGINAVREDIALEPVFWAQFPGNFRYIARRGLISTTNFAGLASLHNFPVGRATGNHWGEAVTLLETTAAGPYFFNFHHGDLGNFTMIGPSGSGKTVVLSFLLAQAQKYDPRIILFDKDRGAELFIRAIGGRYDRLRPEARAELNPLQLDDTPANRQFLIDWLELLAGSLDSEEQQLVREALETNFIQPRSKRRLRHLVELFRGHGRPHASDLYARLRPWWGDGEFAWLFDNENDTTDLAARTIGFDMTAILDDPRLRTPAMLYFFHRVEERLDGDPTIIVIDEGWKALDDEVFVRRIRDWEKTIRKRNGIVGFATQSAQDALESKIASAIIEQAATQIFMINPKARAEDYIDGFGLSEHEFDLVRSLPDNSHCFLIRHGKESVVARLDLTGEHDLLTILSGREKTVRLYDEIVEEIGAGSSEWIDRLLERAA
ncbi:VirB4 family type IV secretion/conjugal transfer ATPase [Blastomonas marina]|uniref:VirB4 family type IV secretion/conjugal transfer ATPase n=1 Tax=Blastomonas marina TaxID=1867408 RepID=UPI002AC99D72|nr:VirB4 family type IV secretion/conjugal transfer ATPase [Blastomonas marina]WPZ03963.1 VirB4 family type IV secretion/conjugal transfer ATPase [Blastomonas marina]